MSGDDRSAGGLGPSRFVLLAAPSANRVYADAAVRLTRAELTAFGRVLSAPLQDVAEVRLGGLRYVGFSSSGLSDRDLAHLANLSSVYALFEVVGDLLRPVPLAPLARYDDDLITIPKYAGKTNEQFTKLLLNLTVLASASAPRMLDGGLTVLDPLCGRGTTLNQALMYSYDAIGIETDGKDVDAYAAFLRTWLRRKRLKHQADLHPVRKDRRLVARRFEAVIEGRQRVVVYHGDTIEAREFLRAECADVLVADAPYGVAHGSHTGGGRSRDPLALLRAAVPVWVRLLRPGGALGLSWNTFVAKREDAAQVLTEHGLTVVAAPGYLDLEHRVDQAINRDVLVVTR
ncbi:MAG TPA: SAM-dependent methyltransferase [Rugosimonospora sp.]|nr:SAM-dependent methyltransferase [Rugosimonospora sp.]